MNGRRKGLAALVAVAIGLTTGCTVPRPPGDETLRYRDQVFNAVTVTSNLQYGTAPDGQGNPVALTLDLYRPPASDTATSRPALVWVHGGGFSGGDKTNVVPVDVANTFARLGYVVVSINYRLLGSGCVANPGSSTCTVAALEAQHDAQAAVRWLRANAATYGIDTSRIGIGGESAGGITAALVGLHSEDVGSSGNAGFPSTVSGFVSVSGGLPNGVFASPGDAFGLFFHGTADNVVSSAWSDATAGAMLRAGVPAWLQHQQGAGHVPWAQYRTLYLEQANYFLYLALDLAHAAGQPAAAARASERQLERLAASPRAKRLLKRHPKLNRLEKQARQLAR
ncbi:MAG: alpha/beta hydrolase [Thermoleophilaceae bacterium]|nr:alpha/beta hydrolase [Thermoleophilaceae bacterium]